MGFFANQDAARRQTWRLIILFITAVAATIAAVDIAVHIILELTKNVFLHVAPSFKLYAILSGVVLAIIAFFTLLEISRLWGGGEAVALELGGRQLSSFTADPGELRLINVVEEMAVASGTALPQLFVMDSEAGINAFAAGFSPNAAAIAVSRGALDQLNRDELQGVIGHEFSHILNGDMCLNVRLMAVLGGILGLYVLGKDIVHILSKLRHPLIYLWTSPIILPGFLLGFALIAIGSVGLLFARLIKASVSRQREFLADASSVQFTRNPDGIGGALAKIAGSKGASLIAHPHAETVSHMFFSEALKTRQSGAMATHPSVSERLEKIYGRPVALSSLIARSVKMAGAQQAAASSSFAGEFAAESRAGGSQIADAPSHHPAQVRVAAVADAVGTASTKHIDYAVALLKSIPQDLREKCRTPQGAKLGVYGLILDVVGASKKAQLQVLKEAGEDADAAFATAATIQALGKAARLPLIALVTPVLKTLPEADRLQLLSLVGKLIESDRRVTLEEFVLSALLNSALGPRAGRWVPAKYHSLEPLAEDIRLVLSLFAHASGRDSHKAFEHGVRELGLSPAPTLLEVRRVSLAAVTSALERLNQLAPLQKPRLVKALAQSALADGKLILAEAELLRAICATIDSPLPPFLESGAETLAPKKVRAKPTVATERA
jgi:Zn-dependent protease with chaperone function